MLRKRARVLIGLLIGLGLWNVVEAHAQVVVSFYHGSGGDSKVVGATATDPITGSRRFSWELKSGSEVCVRVLNPHPVLYSYVLNAEVDTSTPKLPGLPVGVMEGLKALATAYSSLPGVQAAVGTRDSLTLFEELLDSLATDLLRADSIVTDADIAEPLADVLSSRESAVGFRHSKKRLAQLSGEAGRFNDRRLRETLVMWSSAARRAAARLPTGSVAPNLVTAFAAYAGTLVAHRDAIQASYMNAPTEVRACGNVGKGTTTFELRIARKDSTANRDTGNEYFTAEVQPIYERGIIEVAPAAFMGFATGISSFTLVNDTIRETRGTVFPVRVGAVFIFNTARFGPRNEGAFGVGLGFGFLGENKVLSDVFGAAVVSYRDLFRVGMGIGRTTLPQQLRSPAVVGEPLPANAGKLEDLVESSSALAGYIVFQIAGFDLVKK